MLKKHKTLAVSIFNGEKKIRIGPPLFLRLNNQRSNLIVF